MNQDAFLRTISDNPDDVVTRLVFADWLDENGDGDRAEFIRGQCQLAQMREWDEGHARLWARCSHLLRKHRENWSGELTAVARTGGEWWALPTFVRGFPELVTTSSLRFAEVRARLFKLAPLRGLHFEEPYGELLNRDFWECEGLGRLREVWIYRSEGDRRMRSSWSAKSFRTPTLAGLTTLGIPSDVVEDFPAALATAPFAPQLERLEVAGRWMEASGWDVLCRARALGGLRRFAFRTRHRLQSVFPLAGLLSAPWFAGLDWLELAGAEGWRSPAPLPAYPLLSQAIGAAPLRALAIEGCALPESEAAALRSMPAVPLEHLDLGSGAGIGRKVLRAALQCSALSGLRSFALSGQGDAVIHYLGESPLRHTLRVLRLTGCQPTGLTRLARAGMPRLERLSLGIYLHHSPSDREAERSARQALDALLSRENLPALTSLEIAPSGTPVPPLIRAFANNPGVAHLSELSLRMPVLGTDAVKTLAESPHLGSLDRLEIRQDSLGAKEEQQPNRAILSDRFGPRLDCERQTWPRHLSDLR